jgi:hypothetical protein
MLLAKINPAASFVSSSTPFAAPTTVTADFMTVTARPYQVGASKTNFDVSFLDATLDATGKVTEVKNVGRISLQLADTDLATWGADDTVLLGIIAGKLGTAVESTVTYEGRGFGF